MASTLQNKLIGESISELYLNSHMADVHFVFKHDRMIRCDVKVPAHKTILAMASTVFHAMFFGPLKEKDVVEIVDADSTVFKEFLQMFYLPQIKLNIENIEDVVRLADKYDMLKKLNSCATFSPDQLTKKNLIWAYQLSMSLHNQALKHLCEAKFDTLTSNELKSDVFLRCDKVVIEHILKLNRLDCKEFDLFTACIEWAKASCVANGIDENDPASLKNQLGGCFHLIRFETMDMEEIVKIMENERYRQLFSRDEVADLICMKKNVNFRSEAFKYAQRPSRALQWNSNAILYCELSAGKGGYTESKESTWFSVNNSVLLGEINFRQIFAVENNGTIDIPSKMSIVEYEKQSLTTSNVVLYTQTVMFESGVFFTVSLPRPIIVYPGKSYEIRFEIDKSLLRFYHCTSAPHKLMFHFDEIAINLHRNSTETGFGVVSGLNFNRI